MKIANLYDCFERHLMNLEIEEETEEVFVTVVVENYLVNLGGMGFHFTSHAEDTYREIADEVYEMLRKKIYGHVNVNHYRQVIRTSGKSA